MDLYKLISVKICEACENCMLVPKDLENCILAPKLMEFAF